MVSCEEVSGFKFGESDLGVSFFGGSGSFGSGDERVSSCSLTKFGSKVCWGVVDLPSRLVFVCSFFTLSDLDDFRDLFGDFAAVAETGESNGETGEESVGADVESSGRLPSYCSMWILNWETSFSSSFIFSSCCDFCNSSSFLFFCFSTYWPYLGFSLVISGFQRIAIAFFDWPSKR